eukprot:760701_1
MSSTHYKGPNPFISNSSTSKKSTHTQSYNPFTDPKNERIFQATVDECNQMKGRPSQQQTQTYDTNSIPVDPSNPYLNDPILQAAMQQFNPFANKHYNNHNKEGNQNIEYVNDEEGSATAYH